MSLTNGPLEMAIMEAMGFIGIWIRCTLLLFIPVKMSMKSAPGSWDCLIAITQEPTGSILEDNSSRPHAGIRVSQLP